MIAPVAPLAPAVTPEALGESDRARPTGGSLSERAEAARGREDARTGRRVPHAEQGHRGRHVDVRA